MADKKGKSNEQLLQDLEDRAVDAERRLAALESTRADPNSRADLGSDVVSTLQAVKELLSKAKERQLQLEKREAELAKAAKQSKIAGDALQTKNSKLEYQIIHLKRAVREAEAAKAGSK